MTGIPRPAAALRPRLHFTAPQAWLNDPHGVCWVDGEYHLFYQHNPEGNEWSPTVHWGHATSPDLVHWQHLPIALTPRDGEGCWTGATVIEDGRPTIFYTSVDASNPSIGRVAVALADPALRTWTSSEVDVVIEGPPPGLGATVFRDPCILATDAGWTMIVGVGVTGGTGLAVQYTSQDRRSWTYGGVLCSRPADATDGTWTGTMWECPQLFQVGDDWVLAVSVWDDDRLFYVAAAVGSYDGDTFTPERWHRLTHDDTAYAMTSFADRDGLPCVMFWLREDPDHRPGSRSWAGALSLPMTIEVADDRTLRLRPHSDVERLRQAEQLFELTPTAVRLADATGGLSVELPLEKTDNWVLTLEGADGPLLAVWAVGGAVTVHRPGHPSVAVPVSGRSAQLIVDAGIVEIFSGDGVAVFRFLADVESALTVLGSAGTQAVVHRLSSAPGAR